MVKQYPYECLWTNSVDGGTDENGFPLPSTGEELSSKCRYEAFTVGNYRELLNENNEVVYATGAVYFKRGTVFPDRFKVVSIPDYGLTAQVLHVYKGQLNTTVFVYELLK